MLIIHHEDRSYMMSTTGTICATNPSTRSTQIVRCVRDVCSSTCGLNVRLVSSSSRLSVSGLKFPCNGLLLWAIPNQLESTKKTFMKRLCVSVGVPNYVGVSFSSIGFWSLRLNFDPRQPSSESMRFFDPESTIYDGRVAGLQELARPLTADILRKEAKQLAKRPYSLSEFNCALSDLSAMYAIVP